MFSPHESQLTYVCLGKVPGATFSSAARPERGAEVAIVVVQWGTSTEQKPQNAGHVELHFVYRNLYNAWDCWYTPINNL